MNVLLEDILGILDEEERNLKDRITGLKEEREFNELVGRLKELKQIHTKLTTRYESGY